MLCCAGIALTSTTFKAFVFLLYLFFKLCIWYAFPKHLWSIWIMCYCPNIYQSVPLLFIHLGRKSYLIVYSLLPHTLNWFALKQRSHWAVIIFIVLKHVKNSSYITHLWKFLIAKFQSIQDLWEKKVTNKSISFFIAACLLNKRRNVNVYNFKHFLLASSEPRKAAQGQVPHGAHSAGITT